MPASCFVQVTYIYFYLVWSEDDICSNEEGAVFGRWNDVIGDVPHSVVEVSPFEWDE